MDSRVIAHAEHEDMLRTSDILIQEGCFPVRIVLYKRPGKFVVHSEILEGVLAPGSTPSPEGHDDTGTGCKFRHRAYDQGNYFDFKHGKILHLPEENVMLKAGMACFDERVARLFKHPAHSLAPDQMGALEGIRDRLFDLVEKGQKVDVGSLLYSLNHIIVNKLNGQEHFRDDISGESKFCRVVDDIPYGNSFDG